MLEKYIFNVHQIDCSVSFMVFSVVVYGLSTYH